MNEREFVEKNEWLLRGKARKKTRVAQRKEDRNNRIMAVEKAEQCKCKTKVLLTSDERVSDSENECCHAERMWCKELKRVSDSENECCHAKRMWCKELKRVSDAENEYCHVLKECGVKD
jgi:hypothetical protein